MESKFLLLQFAECFRMKRKELKKTQLEFYSFLYPDKKKQPENIKKYISNIENAKIKYLDADLVIRFCQKCDISADYLLGISTDYSNHETEFICKYTGLNEKVVQQLHKWNKDKNNDADLSKIDEVFSEEEENEYKKMYEKQTGITFLRIINHLFESGVRKNPKKNNKKEHYHNLSILHSLYMLCMSQPKRIIARWKENDDLKLLFDQDPFAKQCFDELDIDMKRSMYLVDDNSVWHPFDPKFVLEQYGKQHLLNEVDILIEQVKDEKLNA